MTLKPKSIRSMTRRLFCLVLAFITPLLGQDEDPKKKSGSGVEVKFFAEMVPPNLGTVFLLTGETRGDPFELPSDFLSNPVVVPERAMVLKTTNKEIPLCSITLPETGKSFAVILVANKPAGYKPIVVRTDDPAFKSGDVFFINRSDKLIVAKLGTTPLALKPGTTAKSRPDGAVDNTYYNIIFATREASGDKLLSSSRWPIDNLQRSYVIFFTSANGKTSFRAIDEYLPAPEGAKP